MVKQRLPLQAHFLGDDSYNANVALISRHHLWRALAAH